MNLLEKFATLIGALGVALLTPGILNAFGIDAPLTFLLETLNIASLESIITTLGFLFLGLAIFFGGGDNIRATLLGLFLGFLLVSTSVDIGFMQWLKDFAAGTSLLSNQLANYVSGISLVFVGLLLSFSRKIHFGVELTILLLIPTISIGGANQLGWFHQVNALNVDLELGYAELVTLIDAKYKSIPSVKSFIDDVENDENLSEDEKAVKIAELQQRIQQLERDQEQLKKVRDDNAALSDLVTALKDRAAKQHWCEGSNEMESKVKDFNIAVTPEQPCVRDFAVDIAKSVPGSYFGKDRLHPGPTGIKQACAIHLYLSHAWDYVNDPLLIRDDYYSAAPRSLSIGLAGDCDDYSIVMASLVEAIGGMTRIVGGTCSGGGHAWAEAFIGDKGQMEMAQNAINEFYKKDMPITFSKDDSGNYWLPLDWNLGHYTCNEDKVWVLYSPQEKLKALVQ